MYSCILFIFSFNLFVKKINLKEYWRVSCGCLTCPWFEISTLSKSQVFTPSSLYIETEPTLSGWRRLDCCRKLLLLPVQTRENSVQKVLLIISSWTILGPQVVRQTQSSSSQNPVQIPPSMTWGTQSVGSWFSRSPTTSTSTVEQSPS